jgi:hypothetical protein
LTATSADEGGAGWRFIAVAVGRLSDRRAVERGAEGVDGVSLEAESDVGVDGGGDAGVGVAEEFLDHDEFDALLLEQGGGRVAEIVESDAAEAGLAEERGEGATEVGRVDRPALHRGEHVTVVLPRFSDWAQRVGRAMRRSEARVLVGSAVSPPALVR